MNGHEEICLEMMDKGFPSDYDEPIYPKSNIVIFDSPSYFMLAISMNLELIFSEMLKVGSFNL